MHHHYVEWLKARLFIYRENFHSAKNIRQKIHFLFYLNAKEKLIQMQKPMLNISSIETYSTFNRSKSPDSLDWFVYTTNKCNKM